MTPDALSQIMSCILQGRVVFAAMVGSGNDPKNTVCCLKQFGYDFLIVDNEHSLINRETIYEYIRLGRENDILVLIRPEEHDANWRCYLDSGINGLILPHVDTLEDAACAVDRAFFPPLGHRGSGIGLNRFILDGADLNKTPLLQMTEYINRNTMLLPQTESLTAISSLEQILRLDGIAGTLVGVNDLVIDIGSIPASATRSDLQKSEAIEARLLKVARICRSAGKIAGLGGVPSHSIGKWATEGYCFFELCVVVDNDLDNVKQILEQARNSIG